MNPEPDLPEHPKGTLAIMAIFGLLFAAAWLLVYFCVFVPRGPVAS